MMKKVVILNALLLSFFGQSQIQGGGAIDLDGNQYATVNIGNQEWFAENLRTSKYSNGDNINNVVDDSTWEATIEGAWCHYMNDAQFENPYGKLYNWYTTADPRNACPSGWHVPTQIEWEELYAFLGGANVAGGKMKEEGLSHWDSPNTGATNESGFNGIGSEGRTEWGPFGNFSMHFKAFYWSSDESLADTAYGVYAGIYKEFQWSDINEWFKGTGNAIRCLKPSSLGVIELKNEPKTLLRILDILGREIIFEPNKLLIYCYSDGSTEKVYVTQE
jgi:uncharacterized protein (TIGR02145 family)